MYKSMVQHTSDSYCRGVCEHCSLFAVFIPTEYEIYKVEIVFNFSVTMFVCMYVYLFVSLFVYVYFFRQRIVQGSLTRL